MRVQAKFELIEAAEWYEREQDGLGDQFLQAIENVLATIKANPFQHSTIYRDNARRAVVRIMACAPRISVIGVVTLAMLLSGCLTLAISGLAEKWYDFRDVAGVREAWLYEGSVFVVLELRDDEQPFLLEIPLVDAEWPEPTYPKYRIPDKGGLPWLKWRSLPIEAIRRDVARPSGVLPLPVERLGVHYDDELAKVVESPERSIMVFELTEVPFDWEAHTREDLPGVPSPQEQALVTDDSDRWLVVLTSRDFRNIYAISGFYEVTRNDWGWYLLMPLTVPLDILMLPLEIISAGLIAILLPIH